MQKKLLPHIVAVAIFALLTVIYFLPAFQGMKLAQGDVTQWEGMSKEITDWNEKHPDDPALWTNRMFGGMPAYQISMSYPGNFVNRIVHAMQVIFPDATVLMFLTFIGFYILLLCFEVNAWLSLAGALAYGLSSFLIVSIEAGHNTKVQAIALMAPALGAVALAYRKNILVGAALAALFLSMLIDANHLQVAYYTLMVLGFAGIYFLIESILEKQLVRFAKASAALLVAGVLAVIPNTANLWSTQEYAKETIRGGSSELTHKKEATKGGGLDFDYATRWSYGFTDGEILSILIPDIKGGASGGALSESSATYKEMLSKGVPPATANQYIRQMPLYWGNQPFTSGPVYFGAAIVFLFLLGMMIVKTHFKWVLLALTVFSMLLSFGHNTPFFGWMFNLLPFFNKFRTPSMALVIAEMAMPLLAILALNDVLNGKVDKNELLKKLKIAGGITAGIVLIFGLLGGMFFDFNSTSDKQYYDAGNGWLIDVVKKDRAALLRSDSFRSLFFIAAAFGLLWFYVQQKLSKQIFMAAITVLFLADGWLVAKRYLNAENFTEQTANNNRHQLSQADIDILKDTDPNYRVFNVTRDPFNDAMTSYYHKSIGGYHAAKLIRYQDMIENHISKNNMRVLNMLNTKYFIGENPQTKQPMAQQNPDALGNAWFVREIKWVENADREITALNDFNPAFTVVIDERYRAKVGEWQYAGDSAAAIQLKEYSPNKLTYQSTSTADGLAVFSEIYYNNEKGWHAYIDGKAAEHFRCNYVLRGIVIPAGSHTIEFKFEPNSVKQGNTISYAGSFLLFALVFGILGFEGYKRYKQLQAEPAETKAAKPAAKTTKKK
ncbi:MAG: YfhO family protein [Chitinophagales bacterium]|nr:YfhO family protein [Chitinophagales bacterium]